MCKWQSPDVIKLRREFFSNNAAEFLLHQGLHMEEIHEGKNECPQKRGPSQWKHTKPLPDKTKI